MRYFLFLFVLSVFVSPYQASASVLDIETTKAMDEMTTTACGGDKTDGSSGSGSGSTNP